MNANKLGDLRRQHETYLASWRAAGRPVLSYLAPCCGKRVETTAPSKRGETWDSLTACTQCGGMHFKIVTVNDARAYLPGNAA